jgi:hypothetical protein
MPKKTRRKVNKNRYKDTYNNRESGSNGSKNGFISWKTFKNKPDFFSPKEGVNKFNIIPFEIKSKNHPEVAAKNLEIGDLDIFLDIWVHKKIGPGEQDVVCLKHNYNKYCPICAEEKKYWDSGEEESAKQMRARRRCLFNIQPIAKGEPQALKVWEVSHYCFGQLLVEEANDQADGEDIINYADLEEGQIIKVRMKEEQLGKNTFLEATRIDFMEREEELEDELIDEAFSFDAGLKVLSESEIEKVMFGANEDEEEKDKESPYTEHDEEDEEDSDEEPDEEEEEEEEETEKERRVRIRAEKKAEKTKKEKSKSKPECFGNVDTKDACDTCPVWDDCMDASE